MTDDDLADRQFKVTFDKLFGPGEAALKKQQAEKERAIDQLERAVERYAAPILAARRESVARATGETQRLRDALNVVKSTVAELGADVAAIAKLRAGGSVDELGTIGSRLKRIDAGFEKIAGAMAGAGVPGVGEGAAVPFRELVPLDLDRPMMRTAQDRMQAAWGLIFAEQRKKARAAAATVSKAAGDDDTVNDLVSAALALLSLDLTGPQITELTHILGSVALDASARTFGHVLASGEGNPSEGQAPGRSQFGDEVFADLTRAALDWATAHAAELVDEINETTRGDVREAISEGLSDGKGRVGLLALIGGLAGFSVSRAAMIAATEIMGANGEGVLQALQRAREAGYVLRKSWRTVPEIGGPCPICIANEAAGASDIGVAFPSGDLAPPAHPNCRCLLVPLLQRAADETLAPMLRTLH